MRAIRPVLAALICVAVVGLTGCAEDNNKTANITSLPGGGQANPPKSQAEYRDAQLKKQGAGGYGASDNYPGAK